MAKRRDWVGANYLAGKITAYLAKTPTHSNWLQTLMYGVEPLRRAFWFNTTKWVEWLSVHPPARAEVKSPLDPRRSMVSIALVQELKGWISREQLRELAMAVAQPNRRHQQRDDACLRLWVGTRIWGGGSSDGRVPWNTRNSLLTPDLGTELADSRKAFLTGQPFRIPQVDGADLPYTSKWLWALGTAQSGWEPGGPQAYILDQRVRTTLGWLAAYENNPLAKTPLGTPTWAGSYKAYCQLLEEAASLSGVAAEKIEWLLFSGADGEYPSFRSQLG